MLKSYPQYVRVYTMLKTQIENQDYKVGDFLPAEPELEKKFNVSRTTVRKAVEILSRQGFVYIQQGRGTEILDYKATQKLQYVTSFSETLREQGFEVKYRQITVDMIPASARIAKDLCIPHDEPVLRLKRLTMGNGKPIAMMTNYLLPEMVPGLEKKIACMTSLYAFLESEYNLVPESATDFISAQEAPADIAEMLEIPTGYPLLNVRRITYIKARPVESVLLQIVGDKYEYCVLTKDRPPKSFY